jgi:histone acetyltransferase (RNA polymerase elongator complex component)
MQKPLVIPVFIPHAGCPHRCVFCNQSAVTSSNEAISMPERVSKAVKQYQPKGRKGDRTVQLAFFGGNFLGLEPRIISDLLEVAMGFVGSGEADEIRFSTRPETVTLKTMNLLAGYPVRTVEIGAQSMNDAVLNASQRGHSAADTESAALLLKSFSYQMILQMMVGLPEDTDDASLDTARRIARLSPDGVRIYPTVVLKESRLAHWYEKGWYRPLSLEAAIRRTTSATAVFRSRGIPVIRMGLQATEELDSGAVRLAGPYHPAFGHLVYSQAFRDRVVTELSKQTRNSGADIRIQVHPADIPRMRGHKNENIRWLTERYRCPLPLVRRSPDLHREWIQVNDGPPVFVWDSSGTPQFMAGT